MDRTEQNPIEAPFDQVGIAEFPKIRADDIEEAQGNQRKSVMKRSCWNVQPCRLWTFE
jgi:hypothetical protein